jgi:hypothetical protein
MVDIEPSGGKALLAAMQNFQLIKVMPLFIQRHD